MEAKAVVYVPRRILIYLGKVTARSRPRSLSEKPSIMQESEAYLQKSISRDTDTSLRDD